MNRGDRVRSKDHTDTGTVVAVYGAGMKVDVRWEIAKVTYSEWPEEMVFVEAGPDVTGTRYRRNVGGK